MSSIKHNNRDLTEKEWQEPAHNHIIREQSDDNIYLKQEVLKDVYDNLFGEALRDYNNKQKRKDRKIDDFYHHVKKSKSLDLQREFIVSLGTKTDWDNLPRQEKLQAGQKLAEYIQEFEERHPYLYVYNAVVHLDEAGAPHAHFNVVPVASGYKNGLKLKPSFKRALTNEGYKEKGRGQLKEFRDKEIQYLEEKLRALGIERKLVGTNDIKDIHEYKEIVSKAKEEMAKIDLKATEKLSELSQLETNIKAHSDVLKALEEKRNTLEDNLIKAQVENSAEQVLAKLETEIVMNLGLTSVLRGLELDKNKDIKFGRQGLFSKEEYVFIPKSKWDNITTLINDRPFIRAFNRFKDLTKNYVAKFKAEINHLHSIISAKDEELEIKDNALNEKNCQIEELKTEVKDMIPHYNDSVINNQVLQELGYKNGFDEAMADLLSLRFRDENGNKISFSDAKDYIIGLVKRKSKESGITPPLRNYSSPRRGKEQDKGRSI